MHTILTKDSVPVSLVRHEGTSGRYNVKSVIDTILRETQHTKFAFLVRPEDEEKYYEFLTKNFEFVSGTTWYKDHSQRKKYGAICLHGYWSPGQVVLYSANEEDPELFIGFEDFREASHRSRGDSLCKALNIV